MRKCFKAISVAALTVYMLFLVSQSQLANAGPTLNDDIQASLSMPVEYINYSISQVNGSLWATVDGQYMIYNSGFELLPLVYPTPPGTTNMSIWRDGVEVTWNNYTDFYPETLHQTGIGDWAMIYTVLDNVSDYFVLDIHYEHPVQFINGSYMFLYDLNVYPYLSESANKSVAYFAVNMNVNFTDLMVQTVRLDEPMAPIEYTTLNGDPAEISVQMVSEYGKPLLGDLLFSFTADEPRQISDQPSSWVTLLIAAIVLSIVILLGYIFFKRFRTKKQFND